MIEPTAFALFLAADRVRRGAGSHPQRILRLRQASGAAMLALGLGLVLAKRPGS